MKHLLIFFLILHQVAATAQQTASTQMFAASDITLPEHSSIAILAKEITRFARTDREKVASIFNWVASNIDYRLKPVFPVKNNRKKVQEDTSMYLPPLDLKVAEEVVERGAAVCEGYARLFKTLCLYASIPCEVVTGFARNGIDRTSARFQSNHKWNAVYFDSSWHLLDVTWASGYISFSNEFVRRFDDRYFLTDPEVFLQDHYPEDLRWTLLDQPPAPREFFATPFKPQAFVKKQVVNYSPRQGWIEANLGDTLHLEAFLKDSSKKIFLIDDRYSENSLQQGPLFEASDKKGQGRFYYVVENEKVKWLSFLVEDEAVLKYRLNIKKPAKEKLFPPVNY